MKGFEVELYKVVVRERMIIGGGLDGDYKDAFLSK